MGTKKIEQEEGVNGLGIAVVNTNSEEFKFLQKRIAEESKKQSTDQILKNHLLSLRFQMETYLKNENEEVVEVGSFLKEFIKALNIKYKKFALYVDIKESNLSALLRGKRKVNTDLALKLGQIFNIDPALWIHIQSKNELRQIQKEHKNKYDRYNIKDLLEQIN